jgi:hypothetical protein
MTFLAVQTKKKALHFSLPYTCYWGKKSALIKGTLTIEG